MSKNKKKRNVQSRSQTRHNKAVSPLEDSQKPAGPVEGKPVDSLPAANGDELQKVELKPQADKLMNELAELKRKLTEQTQKARNAQSDVDALQSQKQQLAEENDTLKRKMQAFEKNSTKELEKTKRSLRDSERKRNNLKSEISELSTRLNDYEQKTAEAAGENKSEREERIADSSSQPTPESPEDSFVEPTPADGPARSPEKRPQQPAMSETKLNSRRLFERICFKQANKLFEATESLSSDDDFSVDLRLLFSSIPALQQLEDDRFSFQVDMHARRVGDQEVIAKSGLADEVNGDTRDYDCSIHMPQLDSGDYDLSVYTLIPAARFEGKERIRLNIN